MYAGPRLLTLLYSEYLLQQQYLDFFSRTHSIFVSGEVNIIEVTRLFIGQQFFFTNLLINFQNYCYNKSMFSTSNMVDFFRFLFYREVLKIWWNQTFSWECTCHTFLMCTVRYSFAGNYELVDLCLYQGLWNFEFVNLFTSDVYCICEKLRLLSVGIWVEIQVNDKKIEFYF